MTEAEYQTAVRAVMEDARDRSLLVIGYLVSQPPLRLATQEMRRYTEWCLQAGAEHAEIIHERTRRQRLAKQDHPKPERT